MCVCVWVGVEREKISGELNVQSLSEISAAQAMKILFKALISLDVGR